MSKHYYTSSEGLFVFIACFLFIILGAIGFSIKHISGNKQIIDLSHDFDTAVVRMPDGTSQTLKIKSWKDFEDGDQLQIKLQNDEVWLLHSVNCILMKTM